MTQYVRAINIANNSIKSFVFDSSVANTFNAASVASAVAISANVSAQAVNTFVTLQTQQVAALPPIINTISITDSSYNVLDDTAANTTGAYLQITGSNFQAGAIVMVGSSNTALTTTLVNSNTLRAQIPAISSGTYPVYVVNTNGGTGIRINGLTTSSFPAWSTGTTLSNQFAGTAFSVSLSASSDSNITYSNTTILPAGSTLAANGLFSGIVSPASNTTFTFTVKASDVQLQDADRTFSVTVIVPPRLWTWGRNNNGQLGQNDLVYRSSPTQVAGTNWSNVSISFTQTIATKTDGTLWTWGWNNYGQLGFNDRVNRSSPTQVGVLTNWRLVNAGYYVNSAIKADGTLWLWGFNSSYGQLGFNDRVSRSSPVQVGVATNWSQISTGAYSTIATKTDGTLWAWGYNFYGQLGLSNTTNRSSPVQVGAQTNWSRVNIAATHSTIATKTDSSLWTWGQNNNGQLGLNDRIYRSSPVQVGVTNTWSKISEGDGDMSAAIKTDGTLWTWGQNNNGQLGFNDITNRSSPVQVGSNTNWSLVSKDFYSNISIKTDGTLWAWGRNNNGQLGEDDLINRSSPSQVGTNTNWSEVSGGGYNFIAKTI